MATGAELTGRPVLGVENLNQLRAEPASFLLDLRMAATGRIQIVPAYWTQPLAVWLADGSEWKIEDHVLAEQRVKVQDRVLANRQQGVARVGWRVEEQILQRRAQRKRKGAEASHTFRWRAGTQRPGHQDPLRRSI